MFWASPGWMHAKLASLAPWRHLWKLRERRYAYPRTVTHASRASAAFWGAETTR